MSQPQPTAIMIPVALLLSLAEALDSALFGLESVMEEYEFSPGIEPHPRYTDAKEEYDRVQAIRHRLVAVLNEHGIVIEQEGE